jgi:hypothetical protein
MEDIRMLKTRNWKLILLLALAIAMTLILTSCTFDFTISGILPTTPVESSIVVTSGAYSAYGYIYVNGNDTGKYLGPFQSKIIYNVLCNQNISIFLVDTSGYPSHAEYIYTKPGVNYVYFNYWW